MATPHFAMVDIPLDGELRWGTRTAAALRDERTADLAGGLRVFYGPISRDIEETTRVSLATCAYDLLQTASLKRHLFTRVMTTPRRQRWFLLEAKNRLREVAHNQLDHTSAAVLAYHSPSSSHFRKALVEVSPAPADTDQERVLALLIERLSVHLTTAAPRIGRGVHQPVTLVIGQRPGPEDEPAVRSFRDSLLAREWPDSQAVGRQLGSTSGTGAEQRVSRERAAGTLFGVWAGRDRGGYRHPDFQFLPSGSVHNRLPELLDALARQPGLTKAADRSGWERAFWLYQPRGRLSAQALALRAASPEQVRADPERFSSLDTSARTPAEVFPTDPQAVIDLARDDATAQTPPDAPDVVSHG